jgi:O-antigen ligase
MLPALLLLFAEWKALGPLYRLVSKIWLGAFAAALLIGLFAGSPVAAGYDVLLFATPMLFAVFLASANEDLAVLYGRVAGTMLCLAFIASAYAIYQYISPPPWDAYWVRNADIPSVGVAEPFGLRVFGTLNAYATFAHYTALTLIVNLPRLRARNWASVVAYVPCGIALLLSIDRSAWLAFAAGLIVYLIAAADRRSTLVRLALAGAMGIVLAGTLLSSLKGSGDVVSRIAERFATLAAIGEEDSFADREAQTARALREAVDEPLGQGLGSVGTAAIAGSAGFANTLDNGYFARFVELGVVGFAAYLAALGAALFAAARAYWISLREPRSAVSSILAAALAVQVMMLFMDLSTDTHNALLGLFFWLSLYIASRYQTEAFEVAARRTSAFPRRVALRLGAQA